LCRCSCQVQKTGMYNTVESSSSIQLNCSCICQTGFDDYVTGRKLAPVPTIFIGGNHEASNVLQELYYGGWVAPNIYFLGFGGVVSFRGLRIGGLSGIFNERHFRSGHFEQYPYSDDSMRSIYHLREIEVFRMAHLSSLRSNQYRPLDIFLSHDWPRNIWNYGDTRNLLRKKPFLLEDIQNNRLGSPPLMALLEDLRPSFWFCAHLHTKFAALVPHFQVDALPKFTKFLSLDKVLPGRY
jgi:lariat debranching enzyme